MSQPTADVPLGVTPATTSKDVEQLTVEDPKTVIELNKSENVAFKEDLEAELIQKHTGVRVYMIFIWILVSGVMIWYTEKIATQYILSKANPSSSIIIDGPSELPMPTAIVCNWNQDGSLQDPTPTGLCPECNLKLEYCYNWNISQDCTSNWTHTPIQTSAGLFDCWSYNVDENNAAEINATGYSGSLAAVFSVQLFPPDIASRAGVQVTFAFLDPSGTNKVTPDQIYNEVRFASIGLDTFYALRLVITEHFDLQPDDPDYNKTRFESTASATTLLAPFNDTFGYIGVSFSYQTLSKQEETFQIGYSIDNLFGDFAGMIGTLMGLDSIKVASALPLVYLSVRLRSLNPLEDHFNG